LALINANWAYDLPNGSTPDTVVVEIAAGDDALTVVDSAESPQLFGSADGSESFETDLLAGGAIRASALAGETEVSVTIEATIRVEDSNGEVLARESVSDSATVTIERESVDAEEYGELSGSGSLRVESA